MIISEIFCCVQLYSTAPDATKNFLCRREKPKPKKIPVNGLATMVGVQNFVYMVRSKAEAYPVGAVLYVCSIPADACCDDAAAVCVQAASFGSLAIGRTILVCERSKSPQGEHTLEGKANRRVGGSVFCERQDLWRSGGGKGQSYD
jgi:hypothetical protein